MFNIKDLKPNTNSRFEQGYYLVKNKSKYKGDLNQIVVRSSYEKRFCQICDLSPTVAEWASEPIPITYISPIDGKEHKYWVDFWIKLANGKTFIVEVKPTAKLKKPRKSKKLGTYNQKMKEYLVNMAKFKAAIDFANSIGAEFKIADENFLFSFK